MVARLKPILPKKYNHDPKLLAVAIEETIDEADKQFARTYRTFSEDHKPKFDKEVKVTESEIYGATLTSGDGSSDNPYPFLARGTKVRYARMTPNFISKTQPGVINSRRGRGGFLTMTARPLPGIESRRWEEDVARIQGPRLNSRLNKAMGRYVRKTGHAI
jgi:hypothetical protein